MRPEFEKYSLIDNYLGGKLSEQENSAFEQSMAEDSSLREEVFDRKVVNEIIIENRFFDITGALRAPASLTNTLFSNSVKRFVGIGAAVAVILFTPYYFIKRTEQPVENTTSPEQKSETVKITPPVTQAEQPSPEVILEEQAQENNETVEATPEEQEQPVEEIIVEKTPVVKKAAVTPAVKKKKKAKSYILEIPIDDPSAKGHQANSYAFSPSKGQSWKIPMHNHKEATVTIFNKDGNEVFTSSVEQGKNTWKGISSDGTKQKAGKYAYLLDYGNGKIEHGHVTINP